MSGVGALRSLAGVAALALAVVGCATTPRGQWTDAPSTVFTRDVAAQLGLSDTLHGLVLPPRPEDRPLDWPFDGYLIGMEEANHRLVGWPRYWTPSRDPDSEPCGDGQGSCMKLERCDGEADVDRVGTPSCVSELEDRLRPSWFLNVFGKAHTPFVSHVVSLRSVPSSPPAPPARPEPLYEIFAACTEATGSVAAACLARPGDNYYSLGWKALTQTLRASIQARLKSPGERPTHVFVMTAGWHARQDEALRDFAALLRAIAAAADGSFRPLPIVLTWDSFFRNVLGEFFLDFMNISSDADEIGVTWANYLIEQVLVPLKRKHGIPIVLVGHSFGARLLARAANSGNLLRVAADGREAGKTPPIDLLFGLQAAMSLGRLIPGEAKALNHLRREVGSAIFTTSELDRAARLPGLVGVTYVSSPAAFRDVRGMSPDLFQTAWVDQAGRLRADGGESASWKRSCGDGTITLVDASPMIRASRSFFRGAHNDVYSASMGRMIWDVVRTCVRGQTPRR